MGQDCWFCSSFLLFHLVYGVWRYGKSPSKGVLWVEAAFWMQGLGKGAEIFRLTPLCKRRLSGEVCLCKGQRNTFLIAGLCLLSSYDEKGLHLRSLSVHIFCLFRNILSKTVSALLLSEVPMSESTSQISKPCCFITSISQLCSFMHFSILKQKDFQKSEHRKHNFF